ncbi:MAG: N-6 DNA methylase [bacterium]|nr:N-6 DNA methylase [bacterium]
MNKEQAKIKIKDLISKYETEKITGKISRYSEEETKRGFIEPLFEALGWNFSSKEEITLEEQISGDRVDYGFYLNGRIKFYLEAKPLKADLHREEYANQAIKYSWNKGVTWAVLTDFESLIIFNALSPEKTLAGKKYLSFTYEEYLTRFDELRRLSKEAFGEDILDKEAEKVGKKLQKISVTETLAKDLNDCREILTEALIKWNEKVDPHLIDEGVQKLLNRLIFIRSAEDRKIEPPTLMPLIHEYKSSGKAGQVSPYQAMIKKFRELDETYNSNLFDEHAFEKWEEFGGATEKVIDILYGKKNYFEYDFSVIPADVLGNVYENYLGHQLKKSKEKESAGKNLKKRKEQGIYYTPKFIVDYIVQNALGPVLDKCKSINDLQKIKILDPACGSGSFLVAAMNFLIKKYEEFEVKPDGYLKIQILQQNIYGVDLDQQAVELARLNLLLNTFDSQTKLPNLGHNIECGNSLISGTDEELEKYFGKNYRDKKPFNWQEEFPEVFKQGGFDCIIGNPPYISAIQDSKSDLSVREFYRNKYSFKGAFDIYGAFLIKGVQLGNKNSTYGWIIPNKLMVAEYAKNTMKFLRENGLHTVIDISSLKVFGNVGVYPIIILGDKTKNSFQEYEVKSAEDLQIGKIKPISHSTRYKVFKDLGIKIASGATGFQAKLLVDYLSENQDNKTIPFVVSGSIDPYHVSFDNVRYMGRNYKYAYIKKGKGIAESKWNFWKKQKIVISGMTKRIEAYYSAEPLALGVGVYAIYEYAGFDPYFLLAVLNSKFLTHYLTEEFKHKHLAGGYLAINKSTIEQLPIIKSGKRIEEVLSSLAKLRILLTDKFDKSVENSDQWHKLKDEIARTDKKIDEEVYELYGLTNKERGVVNNLV